MLNKCKYDSILYYHTIGTIRYTNDGWVKIDIPNDIVKYYASVIRWMIGIKVQPLKNHAHVTLINGRFDNVTDHPLWKSREGEKLPISYVPKIYNGEKYFWVNVVNDGLMQTIREELGLSSYPKYQYHITIGHYNL